MPVFPQSFLDQVRQATDLLELVSRHVPLKRAGANFKGLCPFHQEKTPSFMVSPERGIFHCFGCGKGGDGFKFLMLYENLSFTEAVAELASRAGLSLPTRGAAGQKEQDDRSSLLRVYEEAARFYRAQLLEQESGRPALAYLENRGLSRKTIDDRGLGYAPDRWTALLEHLTRKGRKPEDVARAGLVVPRREGQGFYDRFRERVMIPIRSESGKVIAFGARLLGPGEPKYLNSPESVIYNKSHTLFDFDRAKEAIRRSGFAILMEGYLDCIQAHQAGFENAVACCGTSFTAGQARLLRRSTDKVAVNFDPDAAGEAATLRGIELLIEEGFQVMVLSLPEGEDPDSFIRRRGADAYREKLQSAGDFVDFLIERAARRHDVATPRGKSDFVNEVLPILARVPSSVERVAYVGRLAGRAGISDEAVLEELRRKVASRATQVSLPAPASGDSLRPAERDLIRWLLQEPAEAPAILSDLEDEDFQDMVTAPILKTMRDVAAAESLAVERLLERLTTENDRSLLTRIALEPSPLGPRQGPRDCLNRLREQRWRRELSRLRARLAQGDAAEEIATEMQHLARRIETLGRVAPETGARSGAARG